MYVQFIYWITIENKTYALRVLITFNWMIYDYTSLRLESLISKLLVTTITYEISDAIWAIGFTHCHLFLKTKYITRWIFFIFFITKKPKHKS
jgi:hypothetical protein